MSLFTARKGSPRAFTGHSVVRAHDVEMLVGTEMCDIDTLIRFARKVGNAIRGDSMSNASATKRSKGTACTRSMFQSHWKRSAVMP